MTQQKLFTLEDGLLNRHVKSVTQDYRGFIWVGTQGGIFRFDGLIFKHFTENSHGLANDNIREMFIAPDSLVCIIYENYEFQLFDPVFEKIVPLPENFTSAFDFEDLDLKNLTIQHTEDALFFCTSNRLIKWKNQTIKPFFNLAAPHKIFDFVITPNGNFWLEVGFNHERNNRTLNRYFMLVSKEGEVLDRSSTFEVSAKVHSVQLLHTDKADGLHFVILPKEEEQMANFYKQPGHPPQRENLFGNYFFRHQMYVSSKKQYWCANENEQYIYVFDSHGNFEYKSEPIERFSAARMYHFFFDEIGGCWHAGVDLVYFTITKSRFNVFEKEMPARAIYQDANKNIYVNTSFGTHFYPNKIRDSLKFQDTAFQEVRFDLLQEGNKLWMSSESEFLMCYDTITKHYKIYGYEDAVLGEQFRMNWIIYRSPHNNTLWLGHMRGLSRLNEQKGYLEHYLPPVEFESLKKSHVWHIHANQNGNWICSSSGLYFMNAKGIITERYYKQGTGKYLLPSNKIAHLYEASPHSYWLATKGDGLIHWNPLTGDFEQYSVKNGLSHDVLYSVYPDEFGNLWMSSNLGIMRFDTISKQLNIYRKRDGIAHEEFNTISHLKSEDGTLYLGGLAGVTYFHPEDFQNTKDLPNAQLQMTSYIKYNMHQGVFMNIDSHFVKNGGIIHIYPIDRNVQLRFALLNFQAPKQNKYAFKLEGMDKEWHYQNDPKVELTGLPFGRYELWVKAQGPDGSWTNKLVIPVSVLRPVWNQPWFIIVAALLFCLLIWGLFRVRTGVLRRQKQKLQEQVLERTAKIEAQREELVKLNQNKDRFFAIISHDLRSSVSAFQSLGDLIDFYIEQGQIEQLKKMATEVDRLSSELNNLLNNLLKWSVSQLGGIQLSPNQITLKPVLMEVSRWFEPNLLQKNVHLSINCDEELSLFVDLDSLQLILRNVLSNAIKFSPQEGDIHIKANRSSSLTGFAEIHIIDEGQGIPQDKIKAIFQLGTKKSTRGTANEKGTGLGLVLCKEFAELNQGKIAIQSQEGQGTTVTLFIPLADKPSAS